MVRFKNRYLLVRVVDEIDSKKASRRGTPGLSLRDVYYAVQESLDKNFGQFGLVVISASLQIRYFDADSGICLVRVSANHVSVLRAAMAFVTKIDDVACRLCVEKQAGSIRTCRRFASSLKCAEKKAAFIQSLS